MTIDEFLEARIAEDEADARGALGSHWDGAAFRQVRTASGDSPHYYKLASDPTSFEHWEPKERLDPGTTFQHIARHDPARVLAECAAKRALIAAYGDESGSMSCLAPLVSVYANHPDYNPQWSL
jgi:hypothetical protein